LVARFRAEWTRDLCPASPQQHDAIAALSPARGIRCDIFVVWVDDQLVAISRRRLIRPVDGNHVLYHFLQKGLLQEDVWLFQMLTARLVASLGIWFPLRTYSVMPLLTPYAVRDNTCRKDAKTGRPEAWGSPNKQGYFRDDNTLIKGIPSALPIESRFSEYSGARMGNGFVASHVWRKLTNHGSASQHPLTNSFIPNLVWLPTQVAKLSDREGSFVQTYLQAISKKIYGPVPVSTHQQTVVAEAWGLLPDPSGIPLQGPGRLQSPFSHSWLTGLSLFTLVAALRLCVLRVAESVFVSFGSRHGVRRVTWGGPRGRGAGGAGGKDRGGWRGAGGRFPGRGAGGRRR
jgi:hypothetical protein